MALRGSVMIHLMKGIMPNIREADKDVMEKIGAAGHVPHKQAVSLQFVLRRAVGKNVGQTAESIGINRVNVSAIVSRYKVP